MSEGDNPVEYPIFTAKPVSVIDNEKGWSYREVGVFQQNTKDAASFMIGKYTRNYSTFYNTFCPFRRGDRWFALYSPDYTGTRVMEIYPGVGFQDIGGEAGDAFGFCPVDLYVPVLRVFCFRDSYGDKWPRLLESFPPGSRIAEEQDDSCYVVIPSNHGFVAGCHWGDDSSWKIQYLDLTNVESGVIVRSDLFGYIEMPDSMSLKDAISFDDLDDGVFRFRVSVALDFDLATGNFLDWNGSLTERLVAGQKQIAERKQKWHTNSDQD